MTAIAMGRGFFDQLLQNCNRKWHEACLQIYMIIVLAHWGEHLVQAIQIFVLGWPREKALGILGLWYPWVIKSEMLHYAYALIMLFGLLFLKSGFKGRSLIWWRISLWIQIWHHMEHLILQLQYLFKYNLFDSPVPTSLLQHFIPRVELHLFYNAAVFLPMVVAMYYHMNPNLKERQEALCSCAWHS